MNTVSNEPVAVFAAINSAVAATLAILLFFGVNPDVVGAITVALTAWIGVAATIVRSRVIPTASLEQLAEVHDGIGS